MYSKCLIEKSLSSRDFVHNGIWTDLLGHSEIISDYLVVQNFLIGRIMSDSIGQTGYIEDVVQVPILLFH